jgi:predicted transcriptional regulator of viral defense system
MVVVRPQNRTVEERLAKLASSSHGVVTRAELRAAGVTPAELKHRLNAGALIRVHRGVFRVGHAAPSLEARYMAAVKACGDGALLAGRAAAHLLGLLKRSPSLPEVLTTTERRVRGVITHRVRRTELADGTSRRGIPVTIVPRTLVDLAAVLPEEELARAFHEAAVRHRTTPGQVERLLRRRHNWPGARKLRRVLWGEAPVTLSRLEDRFLVRLRAAGLPQPEVNRRVDARYVDCRWPKRRLTVELDSYRYHHSRYAWEEDRQREREARARGDEFRRYTWLDVAEEPEPMLADLGRLLGRPGLI